MRILVYEFITGGGLIGASLPPSLRLEGSLMRDALLTDCLALSGLDVLIATDPRCPPPSVERPIEHIEAREGESGTVLFERALGEVDAVWPIAPDSELAPLAEIVRGIGKRVLLSDEKTLAICASKFQTARVLHESGVPAVPTYSNVEEIRERSGQWVSKPDSGSGGEGIRLWPSIDEALRACSPDSQYLPVFQPWCSGEALSLSVLCDNGRAALLSVNRQQAVWCDGNIALDAIVVNAYDRNRFHPLAQKIAQTLPGLWGYVGIDLLRAEDGSLQVLEINPRLTTSYCGLRDALGINIAAMVLRDAMTNITELTHFECDRAVTLHLNER
jgi:tyramine---L-glutamate ligase